MTRSKIYRDIGRCIQQHRLQRGLSQETLAIKAGLHRTYLSSIERGQKRATLDTLIRVANALNLQLIDLIPK